METTIYLLRRVQKGSRLVKVGRKFINSCEVGTQNNVFNYNFNYKRYVLVESPESPSLLMKNRFLLLVREDLVVFKTKSCLVELCAPGICFIRSATSQRDPGAAEAWVRIPNFTLKNFPEVLSKFLGFEFGFVFGFGPPPSERVTRLFYSNTESPHSNSQSGRTQTVKSNWKFYLEGAASVCVGLLQLLVSYKHPAVASKRMRGSILLNEPTYLRHLQFEVVCLVVILFR